MLETSTEAAVPLTIVNTGARPWDPARVHLSYHWLWLIPRELPSRSRWDVPYHNGIRTELRVRVPPGGRLALEGRLLAPRWPGLYWLQWDMVEEQVAWFAQNAPRQPRTLVLVLPAVAWLAAPVPLLIALLGAIAYERRRGLGPIAEVVWCAAALVCKPLLLIHEALLEPTVIAYWLVAVTAAVPVMPGLFLPRRTRAWTMAVIGTVGSIVVLADVLYYRFFGDVLSAPAVLAVGQTGHVWGSIRSLLSPVLLWVIVDCPVAIWLAIRISRSAAAPAPPLKHRTATAAAIAATLTLAGVGLSAPRVLGSVPLDQMFRDRALVEQFGVFGFHLYDSWNYARATWFRPAATEREMQDVLAWFGERASLRAGPAAPSFGIARGDSLIVLQVESLQDFAVDYRIGGEPVMPFLQHWSGEAVRFTNVTDQTNQGRTSDAEFASMTSLLPLEHGAVAFRYPGNHYTALPRILSEHGYATISAVAFESGFWNRRVMHPSYGFQHTLFEPDFQMTEQIGWGLNDVDFLQQMVPRLERMPKPFAAWLITLSLHHPYDSFPDRHKTLHLGSLDSTPFGNYLHAMRFVDGALEAFVRRLAADGLLDHTVVVVFGDHDAGFPHDRSTASLIGMPDEVPEWARHDSVPLFVRVPRSGRDDRLVPRGDSDIPAGQTDLPPTLLSLLGIDAAELPYVGRNLFASSIDVPVLRPYGEWIDAEHFSVARGTLMACFDRAGRALDVSACAAGDVQARRAREISRLVVTADLQARLRELLEMGERR